YNDRAPLENHHLAAAFTLLRCEDLNFLSHLTKPDYMQLRKMIIDLVLATDMKSHFNLVGQFNTMRRQQGAATRAASVSNGHPSSQGPCSPALASQASMPSPAASIRSQPTNIITGQAWGSAPQQGGGAAAGSPAKPGFSGLGHGPRGPRGKGEAPQVI
ncbi:phosphodiesterase, partial [Haematococcus lacustris]